AFRLLYSIPDCQLIALGLTRFWQKQDGVALDTAPFVAALECATGKKALVFGKPAEAFFHAAAIKLGIPPAELLMIGDDIVTDVGGAQQSGLKGALVKTGKFRPENLNGPIRPNFLFDSVSVLPSHWKQIVSGR